VFAVYAFFVYGLVITVLAVIWLACLPSLRLTSKNVVLFVIGGFVGMAAAGTIMWLLFGLLVQSRFLGLLSLPVVVVGASAGGVGLVWLRNRHVKRAWQKYARASTYRLSGSEVGGYADAVLGAKGDRADGFDRMAGNEVEMEFLLNHGEQ
jgi:hypothetical protein